MFNPLKYFRNRSVGLALGSGGAKGLAHLAVIEELESMGIPVQMIAGSSIGAVVGALYGCGSLQRFKEDILRLTFRDMLTYMDPVVPRSGLIDGKGVMKFLERYIPGDAAIEDLRIPLAVVATDYENGMPVIIRSGSVLEALRASISIPGVFVPVRYRETLLVDGGVSNPLPVNVVKRMGAGITVAVNLHPRIRKVGLRKYVKSKMPREGDEADSRDIELVSQGGKSPLPLPASGAGWRRALEKWVRPAGREGMPNIFEVIARSVDIMEYVNTELLLKYNKPSVLIEPNVINASTLGFNEARSIINEGYLACARVRKSIVRRIAYWV